jgi:predicted O-methyltransferase YrrM
MIRKGGYLFADNTLWDGHVVENGGGKIDNQTLSLLGFNRKIHQDKRLESVILPLRDGLTIIRKL